MELTFKEDNVLHAIYSALEGEWAMVSEIHPRVPKMVCQKEKQTIGVIGSLAKKGMVECDTDELDDAFRSIHHSMTVLSNDCAREEEES